MVRRAPARDREGPERRRAAPDDRPARRVATLPCTRHSWTTGDGPRGRATSSEILAAIPLCGRGDVNTYTIFAETNRQLIRREGRVGCVVPSGIATDDTTKFFFQDLIRSQSLARLHSFENEEFLFPGVHHSMKFCLLTLTGPQRPAPAADFVFFARRVEHLDEADRHFILSARRHRPDEPEHRHLPDLPVEDATPRSTRRSTAVSRC